MSKVGQHIKKHGTIVAIGLIVVISSIGTYYLYRNNKVRYIKILISLNATQQPYVWLMSLDEGFLKNWAGSLKAGKTTFDYHGKTYNTQGGKATA